MNEDILKFEVVNHLTGEITEVEVKGGDAAANEYIKLKASAKAIDNGLKKLLGYIENYMGEDEKMQIGDGYTAYRQQRESRTWTREGLMSVGLDKDAINVASKINMTLAKEIVREAMERGDIPPNAQKLLNESAEVSVSKPFVQVK